MKIGFLITARLKSQRLKFKLLKQLNGFTVIERVIQRAKEVKNCQNIILCTSNLNQDRPLVNIAKENKISFFCGDADDVLKRLLDASEKFEIDYLISVTEDNPLFSIYHSNFISNLINKSNKFDFIYTSGMPIGLNISCIKTKALKTVCEIKEEIDTEIWGYLINQTKIFNIKELIVEKKYQFNKYRMTLDEIDDYRFFSEVYKKFPKNYVLDILEVYEILKQNPEISKINEIVKQKDLDDEIKIRISNFYKINKSKILKLKKKIYNNKGL